ncbi:MAG TPA: FUSC family protein [Candidatus Choladousia intestinigallinarum]|nr:FUSC family protein [Candidatus Choladousia intestinigallinarum]
METETKASVTLLDVRIAVAILICCLTSTILDHLGLRFQAGEMRLEVIQKMTACISCLLCCQDNVPISKKAGINRLIITAIGGLVGIAVICIDNVLGNPWIMVLMIALGILVTLFLCKAAKVPYINARIGGVTFILVTCTLSGTARIWYGIFRFVSTFYSVLIVLLVTWVFQKAVKK